MTISPSVRLQRAGIAGCVCPPSFGGEGHGSQPMRTVALLGAGASASVLSQALMFGLLPLAGEMLAPRGWLAAVPFVALFAGAVAATFPASLLTDAFGRRAAFALGASLGVAGGLAVAWSLVSAAFWPLVVGAFWVGIANGFALRYRHAAAAGGGDARAAAIVIGSGALVGFVAPALAGFAELKLTPFVGAGTALLAAVAHVFALGAAVALPPAGPGAVVAEPEGKAGRSAWLVPTAVAALAWFGMMAVMAFAPLGLAGCGVAFGATVGAVAWHLVAMYAPALMLDVMVERIGTGPLAAGGLALVGLAVAGTVVQASGPAILVALIAAGTGWSLATSAALVEMHRAAPTRTAVAAHDACILLAGIAGALASGTIFA